MAVNATPIADCNDYFSIGSLDINHLLLSVHQTKPQMVLEAEILLDLPIKRIQLQTQIN